MNGLNLDLTEEQTQIRDMVRDFAASELASGRRPAKPGIPLEAFRRWGSWGF